MVEVKNIFCIGRNYANHALELGNEIPSSPILFSKPTHALVKADGSTIQFPANRGEIHHELEIVIHIGKEVPEEFEVEDVVDQLALGIDFTLRDEQSKLKDKGHPWLKAKGFRNSAIITEFWKFPGVTACEKVEFSLLKNGEAVQTGNIKDMMFDFTQIIKQCNYYFGLQKGDIIYTGTPEGVGPIQNGDTLQLLWNQEEKGSAKVELN
ncbi:fumarylacetoacetate hydrolase family protein [Bacillus sp. AK128]